MAGKRFPPDDPREWLNGARSNLACAQQFVKGVYLEDLCFDAQQAAEKAIKGVFLRHGLSFPFSHDLGLLLKLLTRGGVKVPKYVQEAANFPPSRSNRDTPDSLDPFRRGSTVARSASPSAWSAGPNARSPDRDAPLTIDDGAYTPCVQIEQPLLSMLSRFSGCWAWS